MYLFFFKEAFSFSIGFSISQIIAHSFYYSVPSCLLSSNFSIYIVNRFLVMFVTALYVECTYLPIVKELDPQFQQWVVSEL